MSIFDKIPDSMKMVGDATVSTDDVFQLITSIVKAVAKSANEQTLLNVWNPLTSIKLIRNANGIIERNKALATEHRDVVVEMLKENPIFREAAAIADDVYYEKPRTLLGGWRRADECQDLQMIDPETGLTSGLYVRENGAGKEYIYANAGTNPVDIKDNIANVEQIYGKSAQYEKAVRIALELSDRLSGYPLTFVGHSLGGGIATNNALRTKKPAIVFNPSGLSEHTLNETSNEADKLVTCFVVASDFLNLCQDTFQTSEGLRDMMPVSVGKRHYITSSEKHTFFVSHQMSVVIECMEEFL